MEIKVSLDIQQLIQIAKQLPKEHKIQLMAALNKEAETDKSRWSKERGFLLKNPAFDKDALEEIARNRKSVTGRKRGVGV